jgi:hypothetical protein
MTDKPAKSWPQRLRSFAAFGLPLLLLLLAVLAAPKEIGEPAFVRNWSVEAKAITMFVGLAVVLAGLPLLFGAWSKWIDPSGLGAKDRKPLSDLIDNIGMSATMAVALAFAVYGKELKHISLWWIDFGIVAVNLVPPFAMISRQLRGGGRS